MDGNLAMANQIVDMTEEQMKDVPDFLLSSPITASWVYYNGKLKFAMMNVKESRKRNKLMIDLCYCATAGLINHRVEKTVPYSKKRFVILKNQKPLSKAKNNESKRS